MQWYQFAPLLSQSLFVLQVEQTWEKLETLQHFPLLAEIHHQVTHVVTGFSLQGETKGRGHRHAADRDTQRDTNPRGGNEGGALFT